MTKITKAFKNGHYYSVDSASYGHAPTSDGVAWPHQPLLQLGNQLGYSATITSKDENDFITSLFLSIPNLTTRAAWLGGSSWTGSSDDPNNIYWADPNAPEYMVYFRHHGSDTGYTNWRQSPKEPNSDGTEPILELIYTSSGVWNDRNPGNDNYYVVEWGQNVQGSQNNAPFVLGFDTDTSTLINAKEDRSNGNVKIRLNHAVYGDYSYNGAELIAIPITLGGSAVYGTDYTITAVGGKSTFVHDYSINVNYLYVLGNTSSSGIDNVDLAIIPKHNTTWSGLKDVTITLGADLSTYNIYGLNTTTSHAVGSGTSQQVFIVDDEPTLSLGQGLKQSIYTHFVASGTDTLGSTADTTLFDINGINETDGTGGTFTALGLNDNFGIRWEGYIRIPQTGNYLFNVSTDDGVKLLLNKNNSSGASLGTISNWTEDQIPPAISAFLVAGDVVWLQMDYFENKGAAVAQLNWQPPGSTTYQVIPASALFLSEAAARGSGQGLTQTIYNPFYGATSNTLPDSSTPPFLVLRDTNGVNESDSVPGGTFTTIGLADNFGVRWEGYIRISQTGTYQFQTISDDGVRLSLRQNNATGTVLAPIATLLSAGHPGIPGLFPPIPPTYSYSQYSIDNWTPHGPTTDTTSSITLNGGDVVWVQMDYFEAGGSATANLNWIRTPSGGSPVTEMIPANALFATEAGARGSGLGLLE
ncbi:MAG: PA14 domain-containing protein, partial [Cyanobacteriota bacterium]